MAEILTDSEFWGFLLPAYSVAALAIELMFAKSPKIGARLNLRNVALLLSVTACLDTLVVLSWSLVNGSASMNLQYLINFSLFYGSAFLVGIAWYDSSDSPALPLWPVLAAAITIVSVSATYLQFGLTAIFNAYVIPVAIILFVLFLAKKFIPARATRSLSRTS